ncbi:2Fe-2S iron-sulfur cluster-binding protein [Pseudomonadota bacterium AL_CKDN230030165-1A_HGKHYDSX7]
MDAAVAAGLTSPQEGAAEPVAPSHRVVLQPSGWQYDAPPDVSLMRAARAAGVRLPSSCRNGTCRACMCMLVRGEVRYDIEWPGVTREEREEGWVLPCVAHAESDVVLEVPDAVQVAPAEAAPRQRLTGAQR